MEIKWIENKKENWPGDDKDNEFYLFVHFARGRDNLVVKITSYFGTWFEIKTWRKFDLENNYTHFVKFGSITQEDMFLHKCQYCGVMTTQPDKECYKAPENKIKCNTKVCFVSCQNLDDCKHPNLKK